MSALDANGWERVPSAAAWVDRGQHSPESPPEEPEGYDPERAAHRKAMRDNPGCEPCRRGQGTVAPGPPHQPTSAGHRPHCGCDFCW
jgi:hypothetical protein